MVFSYFIGERHATYREEREYIRSILEYKKIIHSYNDSINKLDDYYANACTEEIVKVMEKYGSKKTIKSTMKNIGGE